MKPISNLIQIMQNGSRMRNLLVSQFASSASFLSFSVVVYPTLGRRFAQPRPLLLPG
eukprot:c28184_g1_i5 orf=655-825(-)